MGDAYGWTDNGRQVFDPVLLERAAADLRKSNSPRQLKDQLLSQLVPASTFGTVPGGYDAYQRLYEAYQSMAGELDKVGVDLADLASRALAAAQLAHEVDPATRAAARHGGRLAE
jgi:hypothetical protein